MTFKIPDLLPWHGESWTQLTALIDRFPHATVISGLPGTGRMRLVTRLAASLLCTDSESRPCQACRNCQLLATATHPDLHVISTEAASVSLDEITGEYAARYFDDAAARAARKNLRTAIVIDQARALIDSAQQHAHLAECKVYLIFPAENMTTGAANALLKVLEEPPPSTYFILVAGSISNLLPTIASRCQHFALSSPDQEQAISWLAAQGADPDDAKIALSLHRVQPFVALNKIRSSKVGPIDDLIREFLALLNSTNKSVLGVASLAVKFGEAESMFRLQQLAYDLIRLKLNPQAERFMAFGYLNPQLIPLVGDADVRKLITACEYIELLRHQQEHGNLDKTLTVEDALLKLKTAIQG